MQAGRRGPLPTSPDRIRALSVNCPDEEISARGRMKLLIVVGNAAVRPDWVLLDPALAGPSSMFKEV